MSASQPSIELQGLKQDPEDTAHYSSSLTGRVTPRPAAAKRETFIGFARDEASALLLHETLAGYLPENNQIHVADFRAALAILAAVTTPRIILVDLSGEDQPINAVMALADVVDAGTVVLAIGETQNVNFYRTVTKGMGVREYLTKPLTIADIERNFLPVIGNLSAETQCPRSGHLVTISGARGGSGASTIATNLAWFIGTELHGHTLLLDAELHTGTVALNLALPLHNGLGTALEAPERVDQLLIERAMQPAGDRLHVLAAQEALTREINYKPGGATSLVATLRTRYNFVVADAGTKLSPFARDLLFLAQQRVIVMDPSVIAVRNLEKLLTLPGGSAQSPCVKLVLNKAGTPGGLSQSYMEQILGLRFDAVIPDLPRIVPKTTHFGIQAASLRGPFRNAILGLASALGATALAKAV